MYVFRSCRGCQSQFDRKEDLNVCEVWFFPQIGLQRQKPTSEICCIHQGCEAMLIARMKTIFLRELSKAVNSHGTSRGFGVETRVDFLAMVRSNRLGAVTGDIVATGVAKQFILLGRMPQVQAQGQIRTA